VGLSGLLKLLKMALPEFFYLLVMALLHAFELLGYRGGRGLSGLRNGHGITSQILLELNHFDVVLSLLQLKCSLMLQLH
jgi:hypothetical protein